METERELAKCRGFDFGLEDHGLPSLVGHFEYEGGMCQGFGCMVDVAFMMRFMAAVGVNTLQQLEGKSCWVTHSHDGIQKIEPLHKADGRPFDLAEWSAWVKERGCRASAHELLTGRKP